MQLNSTSVYPPGAKNDFFEFLPLKRQKFGEMDGLCRRGFQHNGKGIREHGNRNKCKKDNDKNKV
jgi:hypothetical protein